MHEQSDVQLLRDYAEGGREAAFRELVTRHTDLVYSAALRQVNSPDLAGDIAQGVFTDLARKARQVAEQMPVGNSLAGWLHRSTRYAALNLWRDTRRRLANERQAMEQLLINSESAPDWERIRPMLDEALDSLGDEDREALLLRYFKNQDFRAVGLALGISDDTAQKRVSRAVERLREFFSKRNVTIGASGLVVLISANAVQAAPVGLTTAISAAAVVSGTAVSTSTAITATTITAMTTLQKTLVTVTVAALAGTGIYEARQATQLREQNQTLQQQQSPLAEQIRQLQRERDDATNRLADLVAENLRLKSNPNQNELLKLRGQVGALRQEKTVADSKSALNKITVDPAARKALRDQQKMGMSAIYSDLAKRLNLTPEQTGQFNDLLADHVMDSINLITQALHDKDTRGQIDQLFAAQDSALRDQLQALIGTDGLAQYLDYTKNLGSTLTAAQFAGNLTGDPAAVADKKNQLLQAMQQATQSTLAAAGQPADYQTVPMLNFSNIASEEQAAQSLHLLDSIYAQVAANASTFLSADELNKFQEFRTNAIKSSQTMLLMNKKMMAPISQ
ncbi:MAG: sigma-70 family RNA polymerase sigma factor [Verrucomicrobiota bacterium]